ncbi:unnamed protein product [Ixodes hexagonus]
MRFSRASGVRFFRIPAIVRDQDETTLDRSVRRREQWLRRIRRHDLDQNAVDEARVCEHLFVSGKPSYLHSTDDQDWAPSQRLGCPNAHGLRGHLARHQRAMQKAKARGEQQRQLLQQQEYADGASGSFVRPTLNRSARSAPQPEQRRHDAGLELKPVAVPVMRCRLRTSTRCSVAARVAPSASRKAHRVSCQTVLDMGLLQSLEADHVKLQEEVCMLRKKAQASANNKEAFAEDDARVSFYTGLPTFSALMALFALASPLVRHTASSTLSPFQEVLLFFYEGKVKQPTARPCLQVRRVESHCLEDI